MEVETINDKALYEEVLQSFKTMSFSNDEVNAIIFVVAAILLIGNLKSDDKTLT